VKKVALFSFLLLAVAAYAPAVCNIDFISEGLGGYSVGVPANFQIQVCCGTAPYTFSIYSGTFPPGMSMSSTGLITGTPTTATCDTVVCIRVTDSLGCSRVQCFQVYVDC
jgi:hypothetical protein